MNNDILRMKLTLEPTPIYVAKAAWIGVDNSMKREKGKWHQWLSEAYHFFKSLTQKTNQKPNKYLMGFQK